MRTVLRSRAENINKCFKSEYGDYSDGWETGREKGCPSPGPVTGDQRTAWAVTMFVLCVPFSTFSDSNQLVISLVLVLKTPWRSCLSGVARSGWETCHKAVARRVLEDAPDSQWEVGSKRVRLHLGLVAKRPLPSYSVCLLWYSWQEHTGILFFISLFVCGLGLTLFLDRMANGPFTPLSFSLEH